MYFIYSYFQVLILNLQRDTVQQKQEAVDLVEQYQRDQKQAQALIQGEKDRNAQLLKRRLEAKRNRKSVQKDSEVNET